MSTKSEAYVPNTPTEQLPAAVTARKNKPTVLYVSGVEPDGVTECPACRNFDDAHNSTFKKYADSGRVDVIQTKVTLRDGGASKHALAAQLGATFDAEHGSFNYPDGSSYPYRSTPAFLIVGVDGAGKPRIMGTIQRETDGTFRVGDKTLGTFDQALEQVATNFEGLQKSKGQALTRPTEQGSTVPQKTGQQEGMGLRF